MLDDFAVFILTHGRPDKVDTYKTLQKCGYSGRVYILIDNEDKTAFRYRENFGDKVIMFDKAAIAKTFDEGDNFEDRRAVIYARNACFEIAKELGITYFMQLDDDYQNFNYHYGDGKKYHKVPIKKINPILEYLLSYYKSINASSIAIAQGGDYIGGHDGKFGNSITRRRKCMNTFICSINRPFHFVGRINEDVNTYTWWQSLGNLFITISNIGINQSQTQNNSGGMTDLYIDSGTYIKSFYTIMYAPSSVYVEMMGTEHRRLHHQVKWPFAIPCIISEQYRKP